MWMSILKVLMFSQTAFTIMGHMLFMLIPMKPSNVMTLEFLMTPIVPQALTIMQSSMLDTIRLVDIGLSEILGPQVGERMGT